MLDALIILGYFTAIMIVAVRARLTTDTTAEEYFVCGRNLKWYSIAASTIATNLHAGHFLAVIGSAYAFGLAQANFELNAIFGMLMAAFGPCRKSPDIFGTLGRRKRKHAVF